MPIETAGFWWAGRIVIEYLAGRQAPLDQRTIEPDRPTVIEYSIRLHPLPCNFYKVSHQNPFLISPALRVCNPSCLIVGVELALPERRGGYATQMDRHHGPNLTD